MRLKHEAINHVEQSVIMLQNHMQNFFLWCSFSPSTICVYSSQVTQRGLTSFILRSASEIQCPRDSVVYLYTAAGIVASFLHDKGKSDLLSFVTLMSVVNDSLLAQSRPDRDLPTIESVLAVFPSVEMVYLHACVVLITLDRRGRSLYHFLPFFFLIKQ